jgi:hypothetical protein
LWPVLLQSLGAKKNRTPRAIDMAAEKTIIFLCNGSAFCGDPSPPVQDLQQMKATQLKKKDQGY